MTGGLMQLVAYGAQDIYLTGNPLITFFKTVYRRHTNFAMESIRQMSNSPVDFGSTTVALVDRSGDLLKGLYLQATLPDITSATEGSICWTDNIGHYLVENVYISIGGQIIDTQCGDWLEIWSQLTVPAGQIDGYREMIGQDPRNPLGMNTGLQRDAGLLPGSTVRGRTIFVPLQFWFCRNIGLSLPLISLQYHEVKVHMTLRSANQLIIGEPEGQPRLNDVYLWADYIYLDTDERRRFAQISHEYLIEQVQRIEKIVSGAVTECEIDLNQFNHPVKELVWVSRHLAAATAKQWSNYTTTPAIQHTTSSNGLPDGITNLGLVDSLDYIINDTDATNLLALTSHQHTRPIGSANQTASAVLYLDGNKRFDEREGRYFNWVQCREHHTCIPLSPGINVYSFAYKAEQHQPSGTCNFSRISNTKLAIRFNSGCNLNSGLGLKFRGTDRQVQVYAVNYNVLKVMSGMAGLAYLE